MHDNDLVDAEHLNDVWDQANRQVTGDAADADPVLTEQIRRIRAGLETPEPSPEFLADLRRTLTTRPSDLRAPAASAHLGLVAMPAVPRTRPLIGRMAAVAAMLALALGAVFAVAWPADDGGAPLVASALASSEARTAAANPTSTAMLAVVRLRTIGAPVSLWEAPAIGTPYSALSPSTPVELLGETTGRQGERWLHVRVDGATGWVRAQDVMPDEPSPPTD